MERFFRWSIYFIVTQIVIVRLFTETLGILPRFFNALDFLLVPFFVGGVFAFRLVRRGRLRFFRLLPFILLFFLTWLFSNWLNTPNVLLAASLLYFGGHLLPILFGLAVGNLDMSPSFIRGIIRWLFILTALMVILSLTQISKLANNPDALVATFGENANQTAFLFSLILSLLLAKWYYGVASLFEKVLTTVLFPFFFLAGFKAMWVLYPLIVVGTFLLIGVQRLRSLARSVVLVMALLLVVVLIVSLVPLPSLDYFGRFTDFRLSELPKIQIFGVLPEMFSDRPWTALVGIGPGTFTSRAFRTFADLPDRGGASDVTYAFLAHDYHSSLADQYVVPLLSESYWQVSGTISWPYSSYISLIAETGILGTAAILGIYWLTWWRFIHRVRKSRAKKRSGQVWALCTAATLGLTSLLAISLMDNYLESTRLATLVWLVVGLAWNMVRGHHYFAVNERTITTSLRSEISS